MNRSQPGWHARMVSGLLRKDHAESDSDTSCLAGKPTPGFAKEDRGNSMGEGGAEYLWE